MASHNNLCIDLQYVLDKIDTLRKLPFVEQHFSSEDREELDRIWREQEKRGYCSTKENDMNDPEHAA